MELRDLRYFEAIAELGHLGAASTKLHRSQPALTASVRRLEAFCGTRLFERAGRGIRLTPAGHTLLDRARRLRLDVQDTRRELADLGSGVAGHVRIGVVPTVAQFLMPTALQHFIERAPQVTMSTNVALQEALVDRLRAGALDVAVISDHRPDPEFATKRVMEDRFVITATGRHPLARAADAGARLRIGDLTDHGWVLQRTGSPPRDWIDQAFLQRGLPAPRVHVESDMLLVMPALKVGPDLLGFLSRVQLQRTGKPWGVRELPVEGMRWRRRVVAAWRRSGYLSPATRLFVDLVAEVGATMSE